jgi:hypothetical protein
MDVKSAIVVSDAKDEKGLSKEYTDITIHLLNELVKMSGKANFITQHVIGVILNNVAKDTEWFIKLTCMFFISMRQYIIERNFKFFILFDYEEQVAEWKILFGASVADSLREIIKEGVAKIMSDDNKANESMVFFGAILRKSAKYIKLIKSNK